MGAVCRLMVLVTPCGEISSNKAPPVATYTFPDVSAAIPCGGGPYGLAAPATVVTSSWVETMRIVLLPKSATYRTSPGPTATSLAA